MGAFFLVLCGVYQWWRYVLGRNEKEERISIFWNQLPKACTWLSKINFAEKCIYHNLFIPNLESQSINQYFMFIKKAFKG